MCFCAKSFLLAQNIDMSEDIDDIEIRLNPELGSTTLSSQSDYSKYPYIRYDLNKIEMNGDNWSELANKLSQSRVNGDFTIVNIGDSHIQADGNTGTTRKRFQKEYGDAGRGVIIPFKLAGTNEPLDYSISSVSPFVKATLLRQPWATRMGFTGVSLHPETQEFSCTLKIKSPCGYFTILADGNPEVIAVTSGTEEISFESEPIDGGVEVSLQKDCTELKIDMRGNDVNIYGFDLRNDSHGVLYHAIGNNGAAYASYNALPDFGKSVATLTPDLIILSLGTNEAFGRFDSEAFTAQITDMVRKLKNAMPEAKLLLVTPAECQKSVYTGSRRRRRTRTYQVNNNVVKARNVIIEYGRKNNIPVYDFYAVAGGEGSSSKWLSDKLLSSDRIHRTWEGYRVDGNLMYDALIGALKK